MSIRFLGLALALGAATLTGCGKQEPPPSPAPAAPAAASAPAAVPAAAPAPTAAAPSGAQLELGKSVYGKACALCHAAGVGGAPKPGDQADWGPRAAQGKDVLYQHAIGGFTGKKGQMPAKGGSANLSDDEVKAAVDHMVAQ